MKCALSVPQLIVISTRLKEAQALLIKVGCSSLLHLGVTKTIPGDVSYACPAFHSSFGIETVPGSFNHTVGFTDAASKEGAYLNCIVASKGMAFTAWRILTDDVLAKKVQDEFDSDKNIQEHNRAMHR